MGFLDTQALQVMNFSGGLVDDASTARPDQYTRMENFLMGPAGKPYLRPGSDFLDNSHQTVSTSDPVDLVHNYGGNHTLFAAQNGTIYSKDGSGFNSLGAYGSSSATHPQVAEWNRHLYVTGAYRPLVVYGDSSSAMTARSAGLPSLPEPKNYTEATVLANAITLANELRTDLLDHFSDGTDDLHAANDTAAAALITSSACTDLATLLALTGQVVRAYTLHLSDARKASPAFHYDSLSANVDCPEFYLYNFDTKSQATPLTLVEACTALDDLKSKFNVHATGGAVYHGGNLALTPITSSSIGDLTTGPQMNRSVTKIAALLEVFRTAYNAHIADVTQHDASTTAVSSTSPTDLDGLISQVHGLIPSYDSHDQDAETNGAKHPFTEHADHSLSAVDATLGASFRYYPVYATIPRFGTTLKELRDFLVDFVALFNAHDGDYSTSGGAHNATFLHQTDTDFPEVGDYIYAFHYYYAYSVNGVDYVDQGPVIFRTLEDAPDPSYDPHTITNIPTLTNGTGEAWDLGATLKIKIYRTTRNGSTFYYLDTIAYNTTSYTDRISDDALPTSIADDDLTSATLYTTGDVLDNDPPPLAKYIHIVNDIGYYGYQQDSDETVPQRIRQSIQGDIDACPADLYVDLPQPVKGVSSAKGLPLGFTSFGVYRLEGSFNELGQGYLIAAPISETVGLAASYSPVVIDNGCVFAGTDGFYFTDGYSLTPLSTAWRRSYQNLISSSARADAIRGAYDPYMGRVWWSCSTSATGDSLVILDLNYGLKNPAVFTTVSNVNDSNWGAYGVCFWNNRLVRGDGTGRVFYHSEDEQTYTASDAKDQVNGSYINYTADMRGPLFDFGTTQFRKWIPKVDATFQTFGSAVKAKLVTVDEKNNFHTLAHIGASALGSTSQPYFLEETRRMRAGGFRALRKQMRITNAQVITNSDTLGLATIATSTVTLASGSWPAITEYSHYRIYFSSDNYKTGYPVTAGGGTSALTITGTPGDGSVAWVLETPGTGRWLLDSYLMDYAYLGGTHNDADGETTGNAP